MNTAFTLNLGVSQAAVATLATAMMIGLGFLRRPSTATALWSMSFVLTMIASFGAISAEAAGEETARVAALGFMLGAPALIWSGLRATRGIATFAWVSPLQALVSACVLVVLADTPGYEVGFAFVYLGAATVAGLIMWELLRRRDQGGGMLLPLTLASGAFVVLGVLATVITLGQRAVGEGDLTLLRSVNSIGMIVYITCALVSLLFLAEAQSDSAGGREGDVRRVMQDRLTRAETQGDVAWSLLTITLDDVSEIRAAAGDGAFTATSERMRSDARAAFPADSDITAGPIPGSLLILVPRSENDVREHMRTFLRRLGTVGTGQPLAVQLSASIGWAPAREVGYDLTTLIEAAAGAEEEARAAGGDRWSRVGNPRRDDDAPADAAHSPSTPSAP